MDRFWRFVAGLLAGIAIVLFIYVCWTVTYAIASKFWEGIR